MANTMTIVGNSFTLDFLTAASGFQLISWKQVTPSYKDGGIFVDSQISPGRRPVYRQDAPIVETVRFGLYATAQTTIAQNLEHLRTLSDESFDYWLPGSFITSPVYLKVSVRDEPDFRYAMLYKMEITSELPDLYSSEFQSGINAEGANYAFGMQDISLTIERSAWLSHIPGAGETITLTTFEDNKIHAHHVPGTSAACVLIDSTDIEGDMPALAKLTVIDVAALPGPSRIMCGMRSTSRGVNFTPYLNCANTAITPPEYDAFPHYVGYVPDATSPTGEGINYVFTNPAGSVVFEQVVSIKINSGSQFRGRYRVFVRLKRDVNTTFDMMLRIKVNGLNGLVVYETPIKTVTDISNSVIIVDLGEISIPASDTYMVLGSVDETVLTVLVLVPVAVELTFHHVVILPIDEYIYDAYTPITFQTLSLVVDSVTSPRLLTQAVMVDLTPTLTVVSAVDFASSHPQITIPAGKEVKLWFFGYFHTTGGFDQAAVDINATVSLSTAFRYSTLRRLA